MLRAVAPFVLLFAGLPVFAESHRVDRLSEMKTVYLLPMSYGFDQFLANQLTQEGAARVVTHPRDADLIFTDVLGPGLDRKLFDLFPDIFKDPDAPAVTGEEKEKETKVMNPEDAPRSTFGRSRGNYFLVDFRSGRVLWSIYERPKTFQPNDLDKASARVIKRLQRDLARESKQ
jgi:hypothetical protein